MFVGFWGGLIAELSKEQNYGGILKVMGVEAKTIPWLTRALIHTYMLSSSTKQASLWSSFSLKAALILPCLPITVISRNLTFSYDVLLNIDHLSEPAGGYLALKNLLSLIQPQFSTMISSSHESASSWKPSDWAFSVYWPLVQFNIDIAVGIVNLHNYSLWFRCTRGSGYF